MGENIHGGVFVAVLLVSLLFATVTVLVSSDFTHLGVHTFAKLSSLSGKGMHEILFVVAVGMCFIGYLSDVLAWKGTVGRVARSVLLFVGAACCTAGAVFAAPEEPAILLLLCVFLTSITVFFGVRVLDLPVFTSARASSLAWVLTSAALMAVYVTWLVLPNGFPCSQNGNDPNLPVNVNFVLKYSPAILAILFLLMSVFSWVRSDFHKQNVGRSDGSEALFGPELQVCIVLLGVLALSVWIAASLAAEDVAITDSVLRITLVCLFGVGIYISKWIGYAQLQTIAAHSTTLQSVVNMVLSDWAHAVVILLALPVAPPLLLLEWIRQGMRRCLSGCGILDRPEPGCFTHEATAVMQTMASWDKTSMLTKSMYLGIGTVCVQVFVSKALVIFLAWFNEYMEGYHVSISLSILFVVEIGLFLFPPVAGPPLYMIAGIVIIPRCGYEGVQFWYGILASTAFCFFLKLFAIALEQKAIGANMSRSVSVKKFIGVHKPFMKAIKSILSVPGFSIAKLAVLTGGPDWPTSVVTGILDLPLCPMLVGSFPVVILIVPCCVSAGYLLRAGLDGEESHRYDAVAKVSLVLAGIATVVANIFAVYFVQSVMNKRHGEAEDPSWMRDPQEDEIVAREQEDERQARLWRQRTCWAAVPWLVRCSVVVGSLLSTASVYGLIIPAVKPFEKFNINDRVSELPDGDVLSVVNRNGWVVLALSLGSCLCLSVFLIWTACLGNVDVLDDHADPGAALKPATEQDARGLELGSSCGSRL